METIIKRKLRQANVFHDVLCLEQRERNEYKNERNEVVPDFLVYYESAFGFNFSQTKQWLLLSANKEIIEKAYDKAQIMYQKFHYDN